MIVGMRAARALGERRLPKFLFPTLPHPHKGPRKEEMTEQTVKKMKLYKVKRDRGRYERFSKPSGGPFTNTST